MFSSFSSGMSQAAASPAPSVYPIYSYAYPNQFWDPATSAWYAPPSQQVHPSVYAASPSTQFLPSDASPLVRTALGDSTAAANLSPHPGPPASIYLDREEVRKRKASTTTAGGTTQPRASKRARPEATGGAPSPAAATSTPAPTLHGVGPTAVPPKATPPANPARPTTCAGSHLAKDPGRHAIATDVWYFVQGTAPKNGCALPTVEEARERTRPIPEKYTRLACRLCPTSSPKSWANTKGLTETIRKHMVDKHEHVWRDMVVKLALKDYDKPYQMKDGAVHSRNSLPYDRNVMRDKLLRWLAVDDQSINVVDTPEFRDFVFYLNPDIDESDLPHRTKMTELIEERFKKEFEGMRVEMENSPGRIAFTMDVWSRINLESYLAITAHYVHTTPAGQEVLKSQLVAFHHLQGKHSGENMGQAFVSIVKKLGCIDKISSITLDNASNNGTLMDEVANELTKLDIPFNVQENRIRCFPHVVNIAVKAGIKALHDLSLYDYDAFAKPDGLSMAFELLSDIAYQDALKADVVSKARKLINAVRSSGQRREAFEKTIKVQNGKGGWGENQQILRIVGLLRDVDTRWSSTLVMIDRLLELYMAVNEFIYSPQQEKDLAPFALDEATYRALIDVRKFLQFLNTVQEIVSGQQTPTLSVVLPLYEKLITGLRFLMTPGSEESIPKLSHAIHATIEKLEEYFNKSRYTKMYALAMAINPTTKLKWFRESAYFLASDYEDVRRYTREAMLAYRRQLRAEAASGPPPTPSAPSRTTFSVATNSAARNLASGLNSFDTLFNKLSKSNSASSIGSDPADAAASGPDAEAQARKEDERIIDEELLAWEEAERESRTYVNADLVAFWQINKLKYPHLYRVALDVMPVQASAVPCERVFSSSKETDALRRANLSPKLMEQLQILKYIFRGDRLHFMSDLLCTEQELSVIDMDRSLLEDMISDGRADELDSLVSASYHSNTSSSTLQIPSSRELPVSSSAITSS